MVFDPKDLSTFTNKQASELLSNALSKLGHEALGFETWTQAYSELGETFWVNENTIKNDRDSFDPHYQNSRAGWHQEPLKPGLQRIKDYTDEIEDAKLIDICNSLRELEWLPDLKKAFEQSKKASASSGPLPSYLELSEKTVKELRQHLESVEGLEVVGISSSAIAVKTKDKPQRAGQSSIISFAHIPQIINALDYLKAAQAYIDKFALARDSLLKLATTSNPNILSLPSKQKTDQQLFEFLKRVGTSDNSVKDALVNLFSNQDTAEKLCQAASDNSWGLSHTKCFFRADIIDALCCNLLNLENNLVNVEALTRFLLDHRDPTSVWTATDEQADANTPNELATVPRNTLFFGAPGTGKSFAAETLIKCGKEHLHKVVFFSEYQNADFIGTLRPAADGETVTYRFVPGPLITAWIDALINPDQPVVLLIDELNRGNAPSIFGEAFQLLDRDEAGASQYKITLSEEVEKYLVEQIHGAWDSRTIGEKYGFPRNLFITGTMNSADQGVFSLDTAFKRRWNFRYMPIDFDKHISEVNFERPCIKIGEFEISWVDFATTVNSFLERGQITEDRFLGPFFLSPTELRSDSMHEVIAQKVLPYLWEDVLKLDDERSLIFNTDNYKTFTALQFSFLSGKDVFNIEFTEHIAAKSNHKQLTEES